MTEEERHELELWVRKGTMEQRLVERARIVLEAVTGKTSKEIAQSLKRRPATVNKWRTRFSRQGMAGLHDMPRPWSTSKGLSTISPRQVREAIDDFTKVYCQEAHPFEWTRDVVHPGQLKRSYTDLCK